MDYKPFDVSELIPRRVEEPVMPGFPKKITYSTPITIKENYLATLRHEKPLWMPNAFFDVTMMCPAVPDNIARAFVFEKQPMDMEHVGGKDMFGVEWEYVPSVGGSMVRPGKPFIEDIEDWEKILTFPDLNEIIDWAAISERNKGYAPEDKPMEMTIMNGLFERLISFMEMQNALIALVDEDQQPAVHRLLDKLCDMYDEYIGLYKKWMNPDMIVFHDDWGSQRAPFFSPDTVREMLLPYLKRVVDSTHKNGMFFEMHSCGKNEPLAPLMIEAGVDTWQPQFVNDFEKLYDICKDDLTIVVPLKDYVRDDMEESELRDAVCAFIDRFPKAQTSTWMAPDITAEMIYVESRKYYCG